MLGERRRQHDKIELIASENYVSAAVMEAQGSWLTNKYAEGLPGKRYYGGCEYVDIAERLAQERALALFPGAEHVNVQPHSGAQANMAAYFSVLEPGDRIMGMNLAHGGHLTHGMALNFSGRLYEVHAYGVRQDTERIDYDAMAARRARSGPKLIVGGASAYPRTLGLRADGRRSPHDVGAILFIDMAHVAGLVAAGVHPSPFPHADLVTTTTHKTLRGPRGGMIFSRTTLPARAGRRRDFPAVKNGAADGALAASVDRNVFPGIQGGPLMHVIAGKAVAFKLAAEETFRDDQRRTVENAAVMAETLAGLGARVVSGGTDNHLMLVDVTPLGVTGKEAEHLLDEIGITVNKNAIPFDTLPPNTASGIRIGTPATTSRGFGPDEMRAVGRIIIEAIRAPRRAGGPGPPGRRGPRDREPVPGARPAGRVSRRATRRSPAPIRAAMTFIPDVGDAIGPIVVVVRRSPPLLALVLTPVVRRVVLRYEIVDRPGGPPGQHDPGAARRRARGLRGVPAVSPARSCSSTTTAGSCRSRSRFDADRGRGAAARRCRGGRPGRDRRPVRPARALPAARPDRAGLRRGRARHHHRLHRQPVRWPADPLRRAAVAAGLTIFWIVGMINSINWIDGLDGLSSGVAFIAAVTLGHHQPDDPGRHRPAAHRRPVLRPRRGAARVPALELPPGHRSSPGPAASSSSATRSPCWRSSGTAKVAVALLVLGVPIIDTFWIIVRRAVARAARRSARTGRTSITGCWTSGLSHRQTVLVDLRHLPGAGGPVDAAVGRHPAVRVPRRLRRLRARPVPADARRLRSARRARGRGVRSRPRAQPEVRGE